MKLLSTVLAIIVLPIYVFAQPAWEGGVFLGITNYQGDLVESTLPNFKENNFAVGLVGRKYFNYTWSARVSILSGKLSGDDANYADDIFRNDRSASFTSNILAFSIGAEWEPRGEARYLTGAGYKNLISPYVFAGIGASIGAPEVTINNSDQESGTSELLAEDLAEEIPNVRIDVPIGVGFKIDLTEKWAFALEVSSHYPFSDYLDGISKAGNPNRNDWFLQGGINLIHRFENNYTRQR